MNKIFNIFVVIVVAVLILFSNLPSYAQQPRVNVTGTWETDWTPLTLKQSGNKVEGRYPAMDNGEVFGTMEGNVLNGFWIEDSSNERCSKALRGRNYWGKFKMTFEADKFDGKWGYCGSDDLTRTWTGSRECPKKTLADDNLTDTKDDNEQLATTQEGEVKIDAKIVLFNSSSNPPYAYGQKHRFSFRLKSKEDLLSDPIELKVTTLNAEASTKKIQLSSTTGNSFLVHITPSILGGTSAQPSTETFTLRIEALNMPDVQPFNQSFSVQTVNNCQRLQSVRVLNNGFGPANFVYQEKLLYMEVVSGPNQTASFGATLTTPFQVKIKDNQGEEYIETTPTAGTASTPGKCDQSVVAREPLKVSWRAVGGVLSTSPSKGRQNHLKVAVSQKVYFTPTGNGPWSVQAAVAGFVFDKFNRQKLYRIKRRAGFGVVVRDQYCASHTGFDAVLTRTFFIHDAE